MDLPLTDPVVVFAVLMLLFLTVPMLSERARVPGLIGLIVAGAVVGPHGLGLLDRDFAIVLLGTVGLLYLVFEAGLELDLHRFVKYRRRSLTFGLLSFGLPFGFALLLFPWLGYSLAGAALVGAIIGSHTLLAYPIVSQLGIVRNAAVTTVLGGTLVTDTLALAVLAVISGGQGDGGVWMWVGQVGALALYVAAVLLVLPRVGRWFFRSVPSEIPAEFLFLMTALFVTAWGASLAGAQPIIGAFLAGLTLNRLIPSTSPLMTRVRFVGNALFLPFFLISVGMLVEPAVLARPAVWIDLAALASLLVVGKSLAAWIGGKAFRYTRTEIAVMIGLSVPQAAATLAVTLVGLQIGLLDATTVNAVVLLILVTGFLGPSLVSRYGQRLAHWEETAVVPDAPHRILVPLSNPQTADGLLELAILLRGRKSDEPVYPLTVVPGGLDAADADVAQAERMLGHAVLYAAGAEVPVRPLTAVDRNIATGIARGVVENRVNTVVIGWDGRQSRAGVFGRILDQLLEHTRQEVWVARLAPPVATTRRLVVVWPPGPAHGVDRATPHTLKSLASELDAKLWLVGWQVEPEVVTAFESDSPSVPTLVEVVPDWEAAMERLQEELKPDDLLVLVSARECTLGWPQGLGQLPAALARAVENSLLVLVPPAPEG